MITDDKITHDVTVQLAAGVLKTTHNLTWLVFAEGHLLKQHLILPLLYTRDPSEHTLVEREEQESPYCHGN